jgi:hypothetical protein
VSSAEAAARGTLRLLLLLPTERQQGHTKPRRAETPPQRTKNAGGITRYDFGTMGGHSGPAGGAETSPIGILAEP